MEDDQNKERIENYLSRKMARSARHKFEKDIERDEALQEAFLKYGFRPLPASHVPDEDVRRTAEEIRRKAGLLPEPRLSWQETVKFHILELPVWQKGISLLIAGGLAFFIGVNLFFVPVEGRLGLYVVDAYCPGQAGPEKRPEDELRLFFESAGAYCSSDGEGGLQALGQLAVSCSGFCIADYYLAHALLENGRYEEARAKLEACLSNRAELQRFQFYNQYQEDKIRFNLLLAGIGLNMDEEEALSALAGFGEGDLPDGEIGSKARELESALRNPLRRLVLIR